MMKILDRYISKNFIKSYILSLIAFIGIFVLSQLFRVVNYVSQGRFSSHEALIYMLTMLPKIFIQVSPLAVLLGCMMTVSGMASNLEIISLKTSGISFRRIVLFPIIISFIISIFVFFINDLVYPRMQLLNIELRHHDVAREAPITKSNAFLRPNNKDYVYLMGEINRKSGVAKNIEIINLNDKFENITEIITTSNGKYDFNKQVWIFNNANIYSGKKNKAVKSFKDDKYNENPNNFITISTDPQILTIKEIKKAIRDARGVGDDTRELFVELGNRFSFPMASFIISFLGLALGGRYVRGTSAVSLGICVILGYVYYIVRASFEAFATNGIMNPFISGWIPNILFLIIGIILLYRAEY